MYISSYPSHTRHPKAHWMKHKSHTATQPHSPKAFKHNRILLHYIASNNRVVSLQCKRPAFAVQPAAFNLFDLCGVSNTIILYWNTHAYIGIIKLLRSPYMFCFPHSQPVQPFIYLSCCAYRLPRPRRNTKSTRCWNVSRTTRSQLASVFKLNKLTCSIQESILCVLQFNHIWKSDRIQIH